MAISDKIRMLVKKKGQTIVGLAKELEMSRSGLINMLESDSIKVSTLERIAKLLGVPIIFFFQDKITLEDGAEQDALKEKLIATLSLTGELGSIVTFYEMLITGIKSKVDEGVDQPKEIVKWIENKSADIKKFTARKYNENKKNAIDLFNSNVNAMSEDFLAGNISLADLDLMVKDEIEQLFSDSGIGS